MLSQLFLTPLTATLNQCYLVQSLIVFIFLCALSATVDAKLDEYVASLIPAAILFPVKLATFFLYGFFSYSNRYLSSVEKLYKFP